MLIAADNGVAYTLGFLSVPVLLGYGGYRLIRWRQPLAPLWHSVGFGWAVALVLGGYRSPLLLAISFCSIPALVYRHKHPIAPTWHATLFGVGFYFLLTGLIWVAAGGFDH